MNDSFPEIKYHIVAELLIIKFARQRNAPVPDGAHSFWIYYWQELKSLNYAIEPLINQNEEMSKFYEEWEDFDTYLPETETRLPVITLAMKLVLAKAYKYADNLTLNGMVSAINERLKMQSDW